MSDLIKDKLKLEKSIFEAEPSRNMGATASQIKKALTEEPSSFAEKDSSLSSGSGKDYLPVKYNHVQKQTKQILIEETDSTNKVPIERRLYELSQSDIISEPSIRELSSILERFNQGQKELEIVQKISDSPIVYQNWYRLKNFVLGKKSTYLDIYDIFASQNNNVRELNMFLARLTSTYQKKVDSIRTGLDQTINLSENGEEIKQALEIRVIPPELERYQKAKTIVESTDKSKEPQKYYQALRELNDALRVCRKSRMEYSVAKTGSKHYAQDIENKMLMEELFETLLYKTAEMVFVTELYQRTLSYNLEVWRTTEKLAEAVRMVRVGLDELTDFSHQLNSHYTETVKELTSIVSDHPEEGMMRNTNRELSQLVNELNRGLYLESQRNER